ncbi:rhodanese-like domain-containing protein [Salinicoccus siamensis]|uniref:Rhodanese-like domain-containing protein n=1 Tax=Salinicoccus siamensis TaxID=381830 RepID=A0ABV5Z2Z6_9STAP
MFSIFNPIKSVSTEELAEALQRNSKLLDVRTPGEYRSGHIRKSINLPLNKVSDYKDDSKPVYIICQSGMRSKKAAKVLRKKGIEAINVRGGMNQWRGKQVTAQ